MPTFRRLVIAVAASAALVTVVPSAVAGTAAGGAEDLTVTVMRLDRELFDAFNARVLDRMMRSFAPDLEFFHDKEGLQTYDVVRDAFAKLFAQDNGMHREVVPGTVEVYPLPGYGALETGRHRFCHREDGKEICATFSFAIVWRQHDGKWEAARVLSYGH